MIFAKYSDSTSPVSAAFSNFDDSNVEAVAPIQPTIEIDFASNYVYGDTIYGTTMLDYEGGDDAMWGLVIGQESNPWEIAFNTNLVPDGATTSAHNLIPIFSVGPAGLDASASQQDHNNHLISYLVTQINANTNSLLTTRWSAQKDGFTLKLTYTGPESRWDEDGDGRATGDSAYPANKPACFILKDSSGSLRKIFKSPVNSLTEITAEHSNTPLSGSQGGGIDYEGWVGAYSSTYSLFSSMPNSTTGQSAVAQVVELGFENMPGNGVEDLEGVSFEIIFRKLNSSGVLVNEINIFFTAGQDLSEYDEGFDTGADGEFDTNKNFAAAIRVLLMGNPFVYNYIAQFGAVTASDVNDSVTTSGSGDDFKHYFIMTGPADGTSFLVDIGIFDERKIILFKNDSNINNNIKYISKDIDFGHPGVKKNIYKVYFTFKTKNSDAKISRTNTKIYYQTDGRDIEQEPKGFDTTKSINYGESVFGLIYDEDTRDITTTALTEDLDDGGSAETGVDVSSVDNINVGDAIKVNDETMLVKSISSLTLTVERGYQIANTTHTSGDTVYIYPADKSYIAEMIPSSIIKNAYSFQIMIESAANTPAGFEIEDISIIYRMKSAR